MDNINIKVDLKELEDLTKRYPDASRKAREARLTEAMQFLERKIKDLTPTGASGSAGIKYGIFSEVKLHGESVWGMIGTPALYGVPLEYGTKPHPVSEDGQKALLFWVEKKLGLSGSAAKSAAFCICRAIKRRGTKGAHMFERGFRKNEAQVIAMLEQIPEDILKMIE